MTREWSGSDRPLVSVVVPVYMDQRGLDDTLRSLARQTLPEDRFEVIVVDNGSPVAVKIEPGRVGHVSLVDCPTKGSYAARNAGVEAASGAVLAFTDADCIPAPDWLERGLAAVRKWGRPVGGQVVLRPVGEAISTVERYQLATGFSQKRNVEEQGFSVTANLFVARATFEAIGRFDDSLLSGGDRLWGWRAARAGYPVVYAPEVGVVHPCRTSFRSLVRQTRRVAGGRRMISRRERVPMAASELRPHRGIADSVRLVMSFADGSLKQRLSMLALAATLWVLRKMETLRLGLGGSPVR